MKKPFLVIVLSLAVGAGLLTVRKTSNCGGNSAALNNTRQIAITCRMMLYERKSSDSLTVDEILSDKEMDDVISYGWGVKLYWIKDEMNKEEDQPVVVCGQSFGNVPQPTIWNLYRKNPGFAVAYLDGRARVMNVAEFNDFDFSGYTYIHENNSTSQDGQ